MDSISWLDNLSWLITVFAIERGRALYINVDLDQVTKTAGCPERRKQARRFGYRTIVPEDSDKQEALEHLHQPIARIEVDLLSSNGWINMIL